MLSNVDSLSERARTLLSAALAPSGISIGVLVNGHATGSVRVVRAGDDGWTFDGAEAGDCDRAFDELLSYRLIVATMHEGQPSGYMVTPLGCKLVWSLD